MYYKFTFQEVRATWVLVLTFGRDTPSDAEEISAYADNPTSAEDPHGIRHYVYSKNGRIVQIQLHDPRRILPHFDPDRLESLPMPGMNGIMFGNPPVPTLVITFKDGAPNNGVAYSLSPNVFLVFDGADLAYLLVTDASTVVEGAD